MGDVPPAPFYAPVFLQFRDCAGILRCIRSSDNDEQSFTFSRAVHQRVDNVRFRPPLFPRFPGPVNEKGISSVDFNLIRHNTDSIY